MDTDPLVRAFPHDPYWRGIGELNRILKHANCRRPDMKPRNTLVLVRVFLKPEEQVGQITVPTNQNEYAEGEVVAVGPGSLSAQGGRPETFDLQPGQRVLVKHKRRIQRPSSMGAGPVTAYLDDGLKLRHQDQDGRPGELYLFEQSSVIAILGD